MMQEQAITECPVRKTLKLLQGKWSVYVLYAMIDGKPVRFGELKKRVDGITNTMLTSTLKDLEAHGLVVRQQFNEIPPRVEYTLSDSGKAFSSIFDAMAVWGSKYL